MISTCSCSAIKRHQVLFRAFITRIVLSSRDIARTAGCSNIYLSRAVRVGILQFRNALHKMLPQNLQSYDFHFRKLLKVPQGSVRCFHTPSCWWLVQYHRKNGGHVSHNQQMVLAYSENGPEHISFDIVFCVCRAYNWDFDVIGGAGYCRRYDCIVGAVRHTFTAQDAHNKATPRVDDCACVSRYVCQTTEYLKVSKRYRWCHRCFLVFSKMTNRPAGIIMVFNVLELLSGLNSGCCRSSAIKHVAIVDGKNPAVHILK